jgi:uncharacterized protein YegP (UPF0339 family)
MATVIAVHQDVAGKWRWNAVNTANRRRIATSGESFASEESALRAANGAKLAMGSATVRVVKPPPPLRVDLQTRQRMRQEALQRFVRP